MTDIRQFARGQDCQVRIPGVCNHDPRTSVLAHIGGSGMGMKAPDIHGAIACSSCHDVLDGRAETSFANTMVKVWFYQGVFRTQLMLIDAGLIALDKINRPEYRPNPKILPRTSV